MLEMLSIGGDIAWAATASATGSIDAVKHVTKSVDFLLIMAPLFSGLAARYGVSILKVLLGLKTDPLLLRGLAGLLGVVTGVLTALANGTLDSFALMPALETLVESAIGILVAFGLYDLKAGSWKPKEQ